MSAALEQHAELLGPLIRLFAVEIEEASLAKTLRRDLPRSPSALQRLQVAYANQRGQIGSHEQGRYDGAVVRLPQEALRDFLVAT